jgi:hypothetical protein
VSSLDALTDCGVAASGGDGGLTTAATADAGTGDGVRATGADVAVLGSAAEPAGAASFSWSAGRTAACSKAEACSGAVCCCSICPYLAGSGAETCSAATPATPDQCESEGLTPAEASLVGALKAAGAGFLSPSTPTAHIGSAVGSSIRVGASIGGGVSPLLSNRLPAAAAFVASPFSLDSLPAAGDPVSPGTTSTDLGSSPSVGAGPLLLSSVAVWRSSFIAAEGSAEGASSPPTLSGGSNSACSVAAASAAGSLASAALSGGANLLAAGATGASSGTAGARGSSTGGSANGAIATALSVCAGAEGGTYGVAGGGTRMSSSGRGAALVAATGVGSAGAGPLSSSAGCSGSLLEEGAGSGGCRSSGMLGASAAGDPGC